MREEDKRKWIANGVSTLWLHWSLNGPNGSSRIFRWCVPKVNVVGKTKVFTKRWSEALTLLLLLTTFTSSHLPLFFTAFCDSHSIYCHHHPIQVHLVLSFHNVPPTSTSAAFFPLPYHFWHSTNFICHRSSFVSIFQLSFWSWLNFCHALQHFLCLFAFSPVRLQSFSFNINSFYSYTYWLDLLLWLHTPYIQSNLYYYNPLCFLFTSLGPSTITLLTPHVGGSLANFSLPRPAIVGFCFLFIYWLIQLFLHAVVRLLK